MKHRAGTKEKKRRVSLLKVFARTCLVLLLAFLVLIGLVRYFGLPDVVTQRINRELEARGLYVHADQLYIDFFGRIKARNIYITKKQGDPTAVRESGEQIGGAITVQKAQVRFNWLSWWRGEPFLQGASIAHADVTVQLDANTDIRIEDVNANVTLHPKAIEIKYLRGKWYNLSVEFSGVVDLNGFESKPEQKPPDFAGMAATYRQISAITSQWTAREPLVLSAQFKLPAANPLTGELHVQLKGEDQWWKGVKVPSIDFTADYVNDTCKLNGSVELMRGKLSVDGQWTNPTKGADLNFYSDMDLSWLAAALPENSGKMLSSLHFETLPVNQGTIHVTWDQGLGLVVLGKSSWQNFSIGEQKFDSFETSFSYDGKRIMIMGLNLQSPAGKVNGEFFYDGVDKVQGRVDCAIDPRAFRGLFGSGAKPFFDSLDFKAPPRINATLGGTGLAGDKLVVSGSVDAADFAYKGVSILRATSNFDFQNSELHLAKLYLKRTEGEGGGEIWDNFKTKQVEVKGVKGTLNVQDVALILGNKMAEYMQPYQFADTPTFYIDGHFDLNDEAGEFKTNMKARVVSKQGATYVFMKRPLRFTDVDLGIAIKGQKMTLTPNKPLTLFDGQLNGVLNVMLVKDTSYDTQLRFQNNDFGVLMKTFFNNDKVSGRLSGELNLKGAFSDWATMTGSGSLSVKDGELYNIPFMGGLSSLLNDIIPDMGYAKASEALSKFDISKGVMDIKQLDINSAFFVLIGHGQYNFIKDNLELDMRVNFRNVLGLATWVFSKIFEYHGSGPIAKTKWESKNF